MSVYEYRRVRVANGKHGVGDYRVEFAGQAPTHSEVLALLWWIFMAEDRYPLHGRRMFWWHISRVYNKDATLDTILRDVDGTDEQVAV